MLNEVISSIAKLQKDLNRDIHQAAEELGEISKAYRLLQNEKNEQGVLDLKEEACDLLICSLAIYYGADPKGFNLVEMMDTVRSKVLKWESQTREKPCRQ